jgi:hypothetical protein
VRPSGTAAAVRRPSCARAALRAPREAELEAWRPRQAARAYLAAVASVLLALLMAPLAAGHASPNPLDVETHILADDTDDSYALYDGYDIQDVYVREASLGGGLEPGLVFRIYLYGGFGPAKVAGSLHIDVRLENGGSVQTMRASTTDGAVWTGGAAVVEQEFEPAEAGVGVQGYVQLLVPYAALGVGPGDTLGAFEVRTYADGDLRDVAPGGRPIPGTGGAVIQPGTSERVVDSIVLTGPVGYTRSTLQATGPHVTVTVENLITVAAHHILISIPEQPGWTISGLDVEGVSAEPGTNPTFHFNATAPAGTAPLQLSVRTDTGGDEPLTMAAADVTQTTTTSQTQGKSSPGAPLWLIACAGLALLALRRRS